MATILEFRAGYARVRAAGERASQPGTAEVVIFPGVRYERWTETPEPKARGRRARRRDRLELED